MNGARIGITAARRAQEQSALVRALGGEPVVGSSIRPDTPRDDDELVPVLEAIVAEPVDVFVFLTGVGAGIVFDVARRHGLEDLLRERIAAATVVGRGTKPRRILRRLGVEPDVVVDPPTTTAVRDLVVSGAGGRRIVVQGFGPRPGALLDPLVEAGARVVHVSPYASTMPDDSEPAADLARAAVAGGLAAITFTSLQAARQFVGIADEAGVGVEDLNACAALMVAVGPVTRQAMLDDGLRVDLEPETPRMGAMYQALAAQLART